MQAPQYLPITHVLTSHPIVVVDCYNELTDAPVRVISENPYHPEILDALQVFLLSQENPHEYERPYIPVRLLSPTMATHIPQKIYPGRVATRIRPI